MNLILSIITFVALLFYTAIEIKFQLQMMQQNTYRNDRYNRWLSSESFASVSRLVDLFLTCCSRPISCPSLCRLLPSRSSSTRA